MRLRTPLIGGALLGAYALLVRPRMVDWGATGEERGMSLRGWNTGGPHGVLELANWLFWEPAHWVMQTKQFAELRRRAAG